MIYWMQTTLATKQKTVDGLMESCTHLKFSMRILRMAMESTYLPYVISNLGIILKDLEKAKSEHKAKIWISLIIGLQI